MTRLPTLSDAATESDPPMLRKAREGDAVAVADLSSFRA